LSVVSIVFSFPSDFQIILKSDKENVFVDRKGQTVADTAPVGSLPGRVVFLKGGTCCKCEIDAIRLLFSILYSFSRAILPFVISLF
jgi:hypothetical protein